MAVQVNTFLLCQDIQPRSGLLRNFLAGPLYSFFPLDGKFPIDHTFKGYLQLRRRTMDGEIPFDGMMRVVDVDMNNIISPVTFTGIFADGQKFCAVDLQFQLKIPKPGDYEVHCTIVSGDIQTEHSYGFQVVEKEGG